MKASITKADTAQIITQWHGRTPTSSRSNDPLRPDLTEAERCCKQPSRGSRALTANHQSRMRRAECWREARNKPHSRNIPQRDSEEEAEGTTAKEQVVRRMK